MSMGGQDVVVTLVALAAAGLVVIRVAGWRRARRTGGPYCPSCASGDACATKAPPPGPADAKPVTFFAPGSSRH